MITEKGRCDDKIMQPACCEWNPCWFTRSFARIKPNPWFEQTRPQQPSSKATTQIAEASIEGVNGAGEGEEETTCLQISTATREERLSSLPPLSSPLQATVR